MPKTNKHHHLWLHHQTWHFRFKWPKDVKIRIGQAECIKSLQTGNLYIAIPDRDILLAHCKKVVKSVRSGNRTSAEQEIVKFRRDYLEAKTYEAEEGFASDLVGNLQDEAVKRAIDATVGWYAFSKAGGSKDNPHWPEKTLRKLGKFEEFKKEIDQLTGSRTTFTYYLNEWLSWRETEVIKKTLEDGKLAVLKFADDFPTLESVNARDVRSWFRKLQHNSGYSTHRCKKYKQNLQNYWTFLKDGLDHNVVPEELEPFKGVEFRTKGKNISSNGWEEFPQLGEDIVRIVEAIMEKKDQLLFDVVLILMYTGLRPEEACRLKAQHIHFEDDNWLHVDESKTQAGIRDVPIHKDLQPIIKRLSYDKRNKYLLSKIQSKNKYDIRSDPIGKRFGRVKTKLGYGPKHVLYSVRHTVITIMDQSGIPTSVIADTVGHEQPSFTKRISSGGSSMEQKRKAIECLAYPFHGHLWNPEGPYLAWDK